MDVRRSPWRHTCTSPRCTSESEQPYKVAGLRFNPKFISSISKGLSRAPSPSEWEADEDDASPSPTLSPVLSRFSPLFFSSSSQERRNARRCTGASQAHHYIMTPISPSLLYPRCTGVRSRVWQASFLPLVSFPLSPSSLARRASSLFWQITAGEFKASRGANPRVAPSQDRSMENSLEEIPPGVRSVVTRIVED